MTSSIEALGIDQALQVVDQAFAGRRVGTELVATRHAGGRILVAPVQSRLDLPPFDKSAMDGYALPGGERRAEYLLREITAAGQPASAALQPGETVKVMTGAPVPPGTERVVMQEHTRVCAGKVRIDRWSNARNICPQGEDIRRGDLVLPAGRRLQPVDVANLISCAVLQVEVYRRPTLAIVSTGDELVETYEQLQPGMIMNANGPLLAGLASSCGATVVSERTAPDDPEQLRRAIELAARDAELVVVSGGVSGGDYDFVAPALQQLGYEIRFQSLKVKPGRPTTFAVNQQRWVFGLPGNPVSVFLMFQLFVRRALARLTAAPLPLRQLSLALATPVRRRSGERQEYMPARLTAVGSVEPLACHGSAHLLALAELDGFLVIPVGMTELAAGANIEFLLLEAPAPC